MSATLSPCGSYRYHLFRDLGEGFNCRPLLFVMLNPSTADATQDDPTIRRCLGFCRAYPQGPDNLVHVENALSLVDRHGGKVLAAWGAHAKAFDSDALIHVLTHPPEVLGFTKEGHPRHPLYLPTTATPQPWEGAAHTYFPLGDKA